MKRLLPLILLFTALTLAAAETTGYRIVHPDGTVEFTDDPTSGGEEIKLHDLQTVGQPQTAAEGDGREEVSRPRPRPEIKKSSKESAAYTSLNITSPRQKQTLMFDSNGITVTVSTTPKLLPEDKVVISIDGKVVAQGKSLSLNIGQVYRGTHTLAATIVDAQGHTLIRSNTVTFFLRQHSN
jgi:hypothetical protein